MLMKNLLLTVAFVLCLTTAFAQQTGVMQKKHSLAVALEISSYSYKEPKLATPVRWDGTMYGISAEYTGRSMLSEGKEINTADRSFVKMELRYMTGKVDYDGWTMGGDKVYVYNIDDWYIEAQLKLGGVYEPMQDFELWPYVGLGYRYLVDNFQENNPGGYKRTDYYLYFPMGVDARFKLVRNWNLTLKGEFDLLLFGQQTSNLGDVMPGLPVLTFEQNSGYGWRFSARAEKGFKKFGLFAEPFFRYWSINQSEPDGYFYAFIEPYNETVELGIKVGLIF